MHVPVASVTRLRLKSLLYFPQFMFHSLRSIGQLRRSPGYLGGWTSRDAENGFWTATVWENTDRIRAFRNSGSHLKAMPKLLHMCDQASYTHFEQQGAAAPTPQQAFDALARDGKMSKVNAPSARQLAGERVGSSPPGSPQHWSPKAPA